MNDMDPFVTGMNTGALFPAARTYTDRPWIRLCGVEATADQGPPINQTDVFKPD